ncbi:MAG: branched-chain amino acid ABC transporter permease [Bdellovibrionaceae bacterium]|jgi:branched-chain amino acid transport system permease protein|nr:branched-chain amino acid ABC transporter permease [Pseudobdellovibrionaceae bacterium]
MRGSMGVIRAGLWSKGLSFVLLLIPLLSLTLEWFADSYVQLLYLYVLVAALAGLSLHLLTGLTGLLSLGHAGFLALGAYTGAYLSKEVLVWLPNLPVGFLLIHGVAGILGALVGGLVAWPCLKLRGDYLAIATLGFSEVIRVVLLNLEFLGGARGYYGIPTASSFLANSLYAGFWVVLALYLTWRLRFSAWGLRLVAMREDELAAQFLGFSLRRVKLFAFVLSSFFAAISGSLLAQFTQYLNPSSFSFQKSVEILMILILGGMGSITGTLVAAVLVTLLPELLRPLQEITGYDLRMLLYALILILLMLFRPQGLWGYREAKGFARKWL